MKCAVLQSVCNNYESIISLTSPVNKRYAEYYKADYILHKQAHSHNRHPSWNKIYSSLDLMRSGKYDYIFFLDGDAVVIDITRNIFDLGKSDPDILLHLCSDGVRGRLFDTNLGVFLVKCDELMIEFFDKILYRPALSGYYTERCWEQSVIQYELDHDIPYYKKIVKVYDSDYFNHYNGDWVYHPCHYFHDSGSGKGAAYTSDEIKAKMLKDKISKLSVDQQLYTTSESLSSDLHTLDEERISFNLDSTSTEDSAQPFRWTSSLSQIQDLSQQPRDYFE